MRFIVTGDYVYSPDFSISLSNGRIYPFNNCPDLVDGEWHTIAFTYNGAGSQSLYVDHAFVQTTSVSRYNTKGDARNWLGTMFYGASYRYKFVGDLKDIAFYNYALTAAQATTDSITE